MKRTQLKRSHGSNRKKQTRRGKRSYRKQYPVHGTQTWQKYNPPTGKHICKPEARTSRTEFTDGRHEGVGGMAKRAMECMRVSCSKYMGLARPEKMRTHWSHQLPNRWQLCAWFVAVTCAIWCSVAKQAGPWFWWNVSCCIWCILAHKAEQRKLPKQGKIQRARFVGVRRVTRRTNRHAWCRRGGRVALLLLMCVVGCHVTPHVFSTYIPDQSIQVAWAISRKKRNRQMHAKNGNPTYQPKKS